MEGFITIFVSDFQIIYHNLGVVIEASGVLLTE